MQLDYTNPEKVVNFRDVGEFINCLGETDRLPERTLYRGGTIGSIRSLDVIENPRTIFNLRKGRDPEFPQVTTYNFPTSNDHERYQTSTPGVRRWLRNILVAVQDGIELPLFVHCLSGKDRTGIVIALLLHILDVPREMIIDEYLLSDWNLDRVHIVTALDGMTPAEDIFKDVDLDRIKEQLLGKR